MVEPVSARFKHQAYFYTIPLNPTEIVLPDDCLKKTAELILVFDEGKKFHEDA